MTNEDKIIMIGEFCGHRRPTGDTCFGPRWREAYAASMPNYPDDLVAIRAAVMVQPPQFRAEFEDELWKLSHLKKCLLIELGAQDWCDVFVTIGLTPH